MKKLATLLVSTALVGGLTATAFAASNGVVTTPGYGQRGNFATQQQMQGPRGQMQNFNGQQGQVANAQRPSLQGQNFQGPGMRGPQDGVRFGGNDILRLALLG